MKSPAPLIEFFGACGVALCWLYLIYLVTGTAQLRLTFCN